VSRAASVETLQADFSCTEDPHPAGPAPPTALRRVPPQHSPGRDAGDGEGPGGGRAVEEDPAEHLHALDQRAPQVRQQEDRGPAAGPGRRAAAHRAAGGPQSPEDVPEVPPEAQLQADEAGERVGGAGVPGQGEHQAGVHR